MTFRRAVLYIGGASLLVAWFSSAASLSFQRGQRRSVSPGADVASAANTLAISVQGQSKRLRDRMAAAPLPQQPERNPFTFRSTTPPERHMPAQPEVVLPAPVPVIPPEPALTLIGVAEHQKSQGVLRTAVIETQGEELIMAGVGDTVLERYRVTAVAVDAVELTDLTTGAVRRLRLH